MVGSITYKQNAVNTKTIKERFPIDDDEDIARKRLKCIRSSRRLTNGVQYNNDGNNDNNNLCFEQFFFFLPRSVAPRSSFTSRNCAAIAGFFEKVVRIAVGNFYIFKRYILQYCYDSVRALELSLRAVLSPDNEKKKSNQNNLQINIFFQSIYAEFH